ncbi:MAG: Acetyltransferase protein [Polaromonas sp.]|nr:Acetyltransferase protein [Polaromonas sp.]
MPLSQWHWKYAGSPVRGIVLRRDEKAVAFFGGMPRSLQGPSGTVEAVQNGDVMVLPSERGVFTRQGALYRAASAFFHELVGPDKLYQFAFGFPNERHFRLGIKLGLYEDSGRMVELSWSAQAAPVRKLTVISRFDSVEMTTVVSTLWRSMQRSWPKHFIPKRDPQRWTARFASHPVHRYELLVVRRRFLRKPLCAIVLREHAGHIDWLDFVGSAASVGLAITAARHFASEHQNKPVIAMFSQSIAAGFSQNATSVLSDICMPVNARPSGESRPYINNLWCMGGDTDFL